MFCSKSQGKKKSPVMIRSQACIFQDGEQREWGGGDVGPVWNPGEKSPGRLCEDSKCLPAVQSWMLTSGLSETDHWVSPSLGTWPNSRILFN